MTKERLRLVIGENIRSERLARSMSIEELAELLEITPGFVGLIERGQRGATPLTLLKIADLFGVSVDSIFSISGGEDLSFAESSISEREVKRNKITSLISDMSEVELDFIIRTIKGLWTLREPMTPFDDDDEA